MNLGVKPGVVKQVMDQFYEIIPAYNGIYQYSGLAWKLNLFSLQVIAVKTIVVDCSIRESLFAISIV